jgi:hypothetical protein
LKHLEKVDGPDEDMGEAGANKSRKKGKDANQRYEKDYQLFL